jgi:hypothetical protein
MACTLCNNVLPGKNSIHIEPFSDLIELSTPSCKYCPILLSIAEEHMILPDGKLSVIYNDFSGWPTGGVTVGSHTWAEGKARKIDVNVRNLHGKTV